MRERQSLALLISIMTAIVLSVGLITFYELYLAAIKEERAWLENTAKSQARLIEAVARFDAKFSTEDNFEGAVAATLSQIEEAHENFIGFGETGEFTLARKEGDKIVFLLELRHKPYIEEDTIPFDSSLDEPMRRALLGRSGTVIGPDYRGETVLAAYEPVAVLNLGIVAKMDMAEIRDPFIKSGVNAAGGAVVLILFGSLLFNRITNALLRNLVRSELSLKKAQEVGNIGSWEFDLISNKTYWSDELYKIYGLNPENSKPSLELFLSIVHKDDRKKIEGFFDQERTENKIYDIEFRIIKPDGGERIIYNQFIFHFDEAKKPVRMAGINMDITERRRAEEALEESEERFRCSFDHASVGMCILDLDYRYLRINKAFCEMIGYPEKELLADTFRVITHPDDKALNEEYEKKLRAGEIKSFQMEKRYIHKKGHTIWGFLNVSAVHNADGDPIYYVAHIQDTTARKQGEYALKKSEKQYRSLFVNMRNGYAHCKMIFDENNRPIDWIYLEVNDAFEKLTGLKKKDVIGKKATEAIPGLKDYSPNLFEIYGQVALTGEGTEITIFFDILDIWLTISVFSPEKGYFVTVFDNITERKLAEDKLERSEEKSRAIIATIGEGIVSIDTKSCVLYVNKELCDIFGYSEEELIGQKLQMLMPENYRSGHDSGMKRYLESGSPKIIGKRIKIQGLRKDGTVFPIELRVEEISLEKSGERFFTAAIRDITESERAEKEIKDLAKFPHENPSPVMRISKGGILLYANPSSMFILEEWGVKIGKKVPREHIKFIADLYISGMTTEKEINVGDRVFHAQFTPVIGSHYVNFYGLDITEKKSAEEALISSEEKLRDITFTLGEGVCVVDMDLNVTFVNPEVERLLGWGKEDLVGTNAHSKFHYLKEDGTPCTYEECVIIKAIKERKDFRGVEDAFVTRDGSILPIMLTTTPIIKNGNVNGAVLAFQDITKQKILQQQLIQSEKLSSIGTFVSGVAHELNNPLTAVMGYAERILEGGNLPPDSMEDIKIIAEQSERTVGIVKNLLKFSRKYEERKITTRINGILEGTLDLQSYQLNIDNIEIRKRLRKDLPTVLANVGQMQQAFMNIILNAHHEMLKADREGVLTVTSDVKDGQVVITFENNGPPIPVEKIDKIFDPFYTTKEAGEGTGLGMYICYGIIHDHNGRIWVENIDDSGVRFTISLPAVAESEKGEEIESKEISVPKEAHILIVEDEETIREWLSRTLAGKGCIVTTASNGKEAVRILEENNFDIILSDIKMPEMGGMALGRWLNENKPECLGTFILATGVIDKGIDDFCVEYGCRSILKPFKIRDVLEIFMEMLKKAV
jgi:PAS domain S-box-containing protein